MTSAPRPRLAIFGTGGFALQSFETARALGDARIYVSDDLAVHDLLGARVVRPEELRPDDQLIVAIANGTVRKSIVERLNLTGGTLRAATALISSDASIGDGAMICDHAIIEPLVRIGLHFHANIYSYVAHECVIGDYVTFAPRVSCNGNVHIGDGVYIGTGAVIRQGTPDTPLTIGEGAIVGMGAVVTKDVPAGATVVGNPARVRE